MNTQRELSTTASCYFRGSSNTETSSIHTLGYKLLFAPWRRARRKQALSYLARYGLSLLVLFPLAILSSSALSDQQFTRATSSSDLDQQASLEITSPPAKLDLSKLPRVDDVDILTIDDNIKALLDREVASIPGKRERAIQLHRILFKPYHIGITYDSTATKTAQQTFDSGSGNCLSHAALFVAAARYVGLKAVFQTVEVPREWLENDNFYVIPGHVNVAVALPGNIITVEFTDAYSAHNTRFLKSKKISDKMALAEFYNNIGMEHMQKLDYPSAIAYLQKSTEMSKRIGFVWSNLGVAYKLNGHMALAEKAYKRGLNLESTNLSIINNIYILYQQTGQTKKAQKLAKKVERYSKKNPYYLQKLATSDMNMGNYAQAVNLLRKAIRIKPEEPNFHTTISFAYYELGEFDKSIKSMGKAREHAKNEEEYNRFQHKLDVLKRYQASL